MGLFSSGNADLQWEIVKNSGEGKPQQLSRAKVIGGWLISAIPSAAIGGAGITFLPDPEHQWQLNSSFDAKKEEYLKNYNK
jgi:hypothetical protein